MARNTWDGLEPAPDPPPSAPPPPGRRRLTPVCGALLAAAVGVFLLDLLGRGNPGGVGEVLALYGPLVQERQYWRLATYALVHGGPLHLLLNGMAAYTLGTTLEHALGTWRLAVVSLITCVGAAAFALFFDFDVPTVGASGMILGWMGTMLPIATRQGRREIGMWVVQVAIISILPGVSWAAHLGGFLFGLPCGLALRRGRTTFARAVPALLFVTAVVALLAAHPERLGRTP